MQIGFCQCPRGIRSENPGLFFDGAVRQGLRRLLTVAAGPSRAGSLSPAMERYRHRRYSTRKIGYASPSECGKEAELCAASADGTRGGTARTRGSGIAADGGRSVRSAPHRQHADPACFSRAQARAGSRTECTAPFRLRVQVGGRCAHLSGAGALCAEEPAQAALTVERRDRLALCERRSEVSFLPIPVRRSAATTLPRWP